MNMNDICKYCLMEKSGNAVCPHCGYTEGLPPQNRDDLPPGTIIHNRFMIGRSLYRSEADVAYAAVDISNSRRYIIKQYQPKFYTSSENQSPLTDIAVKNRDAIRIAYLNRNAAKNNSFCGHFFDNDQVYIMEKCSDAPSEKPKESNSKRGMIIGILAAALYSLAAVVLIYSSYAGRLSRYPVSLRKIIASQEYNLGLVYCGSPYAKNSTLAMIWMKRSANLDNAKAEYYVAIQYENNKKYADAATWMAKASGQDYVPAQRMLGWYYQSGIGVKRDYGKAAAFYQKAAKKSDEQSEECLAYLYFNGLGVKQDYYKAENLFNDAAHQGNAQAQMYLGWCLFYGKGTAQSVSRAVYWFQMSADQGDSYAEYYLGDCYLTGTGIEPDKSQAFTLFKKSADQGNCSAEYELGVCYALGYGTNIDYNQAYSWLSKASSDIPEAKTLLRMFRINEAGNYVLINSIN